MAGVCWSVQGFVCRLRRCKGSVQIDIEVQWYPATVRKSGSVLNENGTLSC